MLTPRESAALDQHIAGGDYHKNRVVVTCTCGRRFRTIEHVEYGGATYEDGCPNPDCVDGEIKGVEPDEDDDFL